MEPPLEHTSITHIQGLQYLRILLGSVEKEDVQRFALNLLGSNRL